MQQAKNELWESLQTQIQMTRDLINSREERKGLTKESNMI